MIGHSVEGLCNLAANFDDQFSEKIKNGRFLISYYVPTRYPNSLPDSIPTKVYTEDAANGAVKMAKDIVEFIR